MVPAAADEVSAGIAHILSAHAQDYQALAGQAAFHQQFVQNLTGSAGSYAGAEAANAAVLQPLNAIAGSVASANTAAGNPLVDWFNAALSQLQNAIGSFIIFLLSPILNPILDAISQVLAQIIVQIILAPSPVDCDLAAARYRYHDVVTSRGNHGDNTGGCPRTCTDVFSPARTNFRHSGE